ncbi:MAG TPA: DUF2914 domain-containing protein, partial [Nannocystaceae bacterium]|nr:DUF2914 domain-containing protein [Nannocystaceae bacterium]
VTPQEPPTAASEMDTLMRGGEATPDPEVRRVASPSQTRRRAVGLDDEMFEDPHTIVRIRRPVEEGMPPRERTPPRHVVAPQLPPALRRNRDRDRRAPSLVWAVVAGVAIAGAIVVVQRQLAPDPPPIASKTSHEPTNAEVPRVRDATNARTQPSSATDEPERAAASEVTPQEPPTAASERDPSPTEAKSLPSEPPADTAAATPVEPTPAPTRSKRPTAANPRTPPPGTPAEAAATFAKLPVSPADLPPIGGIGRSGIHVDRIEAGSTYVKGLCGGTPDRFSLAKLERVNVCLRVVHPREEEVVSIVWQKNDLGTARRGKIAIKPLHAYRTRAYLVLRKEYVGDWTVRILSSDGVELAAHRFTIVP